jgi:hypothetical protein
MARARKTMLAVHVLLSFLTGGLWAVFLLIRHVTK